MPCACLGWVARPRQVDLPGRGIRAQQPHVVRVHAQLLQHVRLVQAAHRRGHKGGWKPATMAASAAWTHQQAQHWSGATCPAVGPSLQLTEAAAPPLATNKHSCPGAGLTSWKLAMKSSLALRCQGRKPRSLTTLPSATHCGLMISTRPSLLEGEGRRGGVAEWLAERQSAGRQPQQVDGREGSRSVSAETWSGTATPERHAKPEQHGDPT